VCALIKRYHIHLSPFICREEGLLSQTMRGMPAEEGEAIKFMHRVVKTLDQRNFPYQTELRKWFLRLSDRQHGQMWEKHEALAVAWAKINQEAWKEGSLTLPAGLDMNRVAWIFTGKDRPCQWTLRRKEDAFILMKDTSIDTQSAEGWLDQGSLVGTFTIGNHCIQIKESDDDRISNNYMIDLHSRDMVKIPIPANGRLVLNTDNEKVTLAPFSRPSWAHGIGCDHYGLFLKLLKGNKERRVYRQSPGGYGVVMEPAAPFHILPITEGFWWDGEEFLEIQARGFQKPIWADRMGIDEYGLYADFGIQGVAQRMRWIRPGTFMMGSPEGEPERNDNERRHEVVLTRGYWLADTACTQALWKKVMSKSPGPQKKATRLVEKFLGRGEETEKGDTPSYFKGAEHPVESVNWDDAMAFIENINRRKQGLDLRLPTEAEWEYACRAGMETPFWFGNTITPEQVNYDGNYPYAGGKKGIFRKKTVDVKSLPCNGWGLYEMHGNVWEWCNDRYGEYPQGPDIDPRGPDRGVGRVLRGGGWDDFGRNARSAYRLRLRPVSRVIIIGFRLARGQKSTSISSEAADI
jgi:formylglycine-generating enzyme required for sulfatase activity